MTIKADVQKLSPGAIVSLFELDATAIGGEVLRFHAGVNALGNDVVWQALTYTRWPIMASGFEKNGKGTLPRPSLTVANINGLVGALARETQDLVGAKLIRRRTFVRYLDAVNFPGGVNPTADPTCGFADESWSVDRKAGQNGAFLEFELAAAFDVAGKMLPARQCIQNVCPTRYRSAECGYTGGPVADRNDIPVSTLLQDVCGHHLSSCKLRFGAYAELPFGGFPGVGLIR